MAFQCPHDRENQGGVLMWDKLNRADIEQARQELKLRHAEMVRRHAEELSGLDADQAGIETLNQLIGAFAEKYKKAMASSAEPDATREPTEATVSNDLRYDEPSPEVRVAPFGSFQNFVAA
jgi:hypothetical protein